MKRSFRLPLPLAAGLVAIACALVGQRQALAATAVWYVSPGGNDSNSCAAATAPCLTINGAISKASAGDTVDVAVGTYTGSGTNVVAIDKDLTLSGGWNGTFTQQTGLSTIDGQDAQRGVFVASTATATVTRFEVMNGAPPSSPDPFAFGGGILMYGPLTLDHSYVHDNVDNGVETTGAPLTITNSTISGNQSGGVVLYNLFGNFTITITNSTIVNNTGSGINLAILGGSSSSVLTLNSDTINANSSTDLNSGGGISAYSGWDIELENTIVSGNTAPFFPDIFVGPYSSVTSEGYNIGSGFSHTATDMYGDPVLGSLADNAGPTPTMALLSGSPAIDAIPVGTNGCGTTITTDQRAVSRPQGSGCDIGAFELVPPQADLSITKSGAPNPVVSGNRLTYTLTVTNEGPGGATEVTVTDPLPNTVHFNSVASSQGTCARSTRAPKGGTITCKLGDLANPASASITIVVTTTTPGRLSNTATVSGNEEDPNPLNNSATATTTVIGT